MPMFGVNEKGRWDQNVSQQFMPEHVQRIIQKYRDANPTMVEGGHNWYEKANRIATKLGKGDVHKGAGIIAALSPQTGWSRNLMLAGEMVKTGTTRHTTDNVTKAQRILTGEHPEEVLGQGDGHKVLNFYRNIADPSNPHPVTIDRHSHDISVGIPFRGTNKDAPKGEDLGLGAKGRYDHFVEAHRLAAGELGIDIPNKVQATTWVQHRGAVG